MEEAPLSTLLALPRGFAAPFKVEPLKIIMPLNMGQFIITLAVLFWCQLKERGLGGKEKLRLFCTV